MLKNAQYYIGGLLTAIAFLTRLPIPSFAHKIGLQYSFWAFPIVGILLGFSYYAITYMALWLALPPLLISILVIIFSIIITGALHEDGLADTADGFWGGHDAKKRITIMRDSAIGVFGVVTLIGSITLRIIGLYYIIQYQSEHVLTYLVISETASRLLMVFVFLLPASFFQSNVQGKNLSQKAGRAHIMAFIPIAVIAFIAYDIWHIAPPLFIVIALIILFIIWLAITLRKIHIITGDTVGALQQLALILCAILYNIPALN